MSTLELGIEEPGAPEIDLGELDLEEHLQGPGDDELEEPVPEVSELTVRAALAAAGGLVGFAIGDRRIDAHWRFTDEELEDLTPPVTRIVNRSPQLARVVAHADAATAGIVIVRYALRNLDLSKRAKEIQRAADNPDRSLPARTVPVSDNGAEGAAPAPELGDQALAPTGRNFGLGAPGAGPVHGDDGTGAQ